MYNLDRIRNFIRGHKPQPMEVVPDEEIAARNRARAGESLEQMGNGAREQASEITQMGETPLGRGEDDLEQAQRRAPMYQAAKEQVMIPDGTVRLYVDGVEIPAGTTLKAGDTLHVDYTCNPSALMTADAMLEWWEGQIRIGMASSVLWSSARGFILYVGHRQRYIAPTLYLAIKAAMEGESHARP